MVQQDLPDDVLLRKAADHARRLDEHLSREQQALLAGQAPAPESLHAAVKALRSLAELFEKESKPNE